MANPAHEAQLRELDIAPFQLLVSQPLPVRADGRVAARARRRRIEQIDIGGPAMVRAAAKNHGSVAVVTSPGQYPETAQGAGRGRLHGRRAPPPRGRGVRAHRRLRRRRRVLVRRQSTRRTRPRTDRLAGLSPPPCGPGRRCFATARTRTSRRRSIVTGGHAEHRSGVATAELLHGKAMSYNNYVDADAARRAAYDFGEPCVAIIKHSNPCGIAVGSDIADAHAQGARVRPGVRVRRGDRGQRRGDRARWPRRSPTVFTEVVIAPDFDAGGAGDPHREVEEHPAAALRRTPPSVRANGNGGR